MERREERKRRAYIVREEACGRNEVGTLYLLSSFRFPLDDAIYD